MDLSRLDLLSHCRAIGECAAAFDLRTSLDLETYRLDVRGHHRYYEFLPRFFVRDDNGRRFARLPEQGTRGFVGWLPYAERQWPIGAFKLAFKDYCREAGLPTPVWWRAAASGMPAFLVKQDRSSFGQRLRGPFAAYDAGDPVQAPADGTYFEQFVPGQIVKAWYCEEELVALEVRAMPEVAGDGRQTVRTLIQSRIEVRNGVPDWQDYEDTVRLQGLDLDAVPSFGQRVLVDVRYGSALDPVAIAGDLAAWRASRIGKQLIQMGPVLLCGLPAAQRAGTVYSVDAIADEKGRVWLLEMNCNPGLSPGVYGPLLARMFGLQRPAAGTVHPARAGNAAVANRLRPLQSADAGAIASRT